MNTATIDHPRQPENPELMWRQVCWVTDTLAVSGDLPYDRDAAREQLRMWEAEGITDVFDMRGEACDNEFILENSETIHPHWYGVDDHGGRQDPEWYGELVEKAIDILEDPSRKILVHCHMGVNRGPSALFAILLAFDIGHLDALRAIRNARPISGLIYAPDAIRWWAAGPLNLSADEVDRLEIEVTDWLIEHDVDVEYIIRRIGSRWA